MVGKLIEECNGNIEETSLINLTKCKSISCVILLFCIVLFSILFTINTGIATYFIYYKYINLIMFIKEKIINNITKWKQ